MRVRPFVLASLMVAMVFVVTPSMAQDDGADTADDARGKLFLRMTAPFHFSSGKYLTTYPPGPNNTTEAVELQQSGVATATAAWRQLEPPSNWTLQAGTEVEAVVWLRGLRDMVPTYEPREYDAPGEVMVRVSVYNGQDDQEPELFLTSPPKEPLGTATVSWPYAEVPADDVEVVTTIPIEEGFTFASDVRGRTFEFRVDVHGGRGVEGSPVRVLVASEAHPSHIQVPGFPWDTMRAQQDAGREAARCREAALRGETCAVDDDEDPSPGGSAEAGQTMTLPVVAAGAAMGIAGLGLRRRA